MSCADARTHYTGSVYVGKINGKSLRDKEKLLREETARLCHNSFGGRTLYLALIAFFCVYMCVCKRDEEGNKGCLCMRCTRNVHFH